MSHSNSNGVPIRSTEVAITLGGQIAAKHPKFRCGVGEGDERFSLRDLLEAIFDADIRYIDQRSRRR